MRRSAAKADDSFDSYCRVVFVCTYPYLLQSSLYHQSINQDTYLYCDSVVTTAAQHCSNLIQYVRINCKNNNNSTGARVVSCHFPSRSHKSSSLSSFIIMPRRRPGTRHILSPAAHVQKQYQKCLDLEQRIQAAQSKGSSSNNNNTTTATTATAAVVNKLRVPLCEALSDLILTDPAFAAQHTICERLWRLCFYQRISALRLAVHQEKRKKRQHSSSSAAATTTTNKAIKPQQALLDFLVEAAALYEYLLQKLQAKLVQQVRGSSHADAAAADVAANRGGGDSKAAAAASSTTTEDDDDDDDDTTLTTTVASNDSTEGIVDCMTRLLVQIGDLYRYQENFAQAQDCYLRAATLGPGHGHAMNQLAVVLSSTSSPSTAASGRSSSSNSKDASPHDAAAGQRAVALYWYVRGLSTPFPFATARANLVRLWESNRSWLREQQQQQESTAAAAAAVVSENNNNNKSTQNRRFMAHFCEMHDFFFHGLTIFRITQDQVYAKMEACRLEFKSLLQNSALGDSLLCKMVTVCAFSECFLDRSILSKQNDASNHNNNNYMNALTGPIDPVEVNQATALTTRTLTLWLGTELAERLLAVLNNNNSNNKRQQSKASLRLLLPLLLLTEYVYTSPLPATRKKECQNKKADQALQDLELRHEQAVADFWKLIIDLLNQLQTISEQLAIDEKLISEEGAVLVAQSLNEYQNLRGFAPFGKFLPKIAENGVLGEEEALEVLEKRSMHKTSRKGGSGGSKSQESSSVVSMGSAGGGGGSIADQNRMKVARLLWLGGKLAADNKSQVGKRVSYDLLDRSYTWDAMDENNNEDLVMEDATPVPGEESSVVPQQSAAVSTPLVYQQAASGGPALLVPGDLLKETQTAVTGSSLDPSTMNPGMSAGTEPAYRAPARDAVSATVNVPFASPGAIGSVAQSVPTPSVVAAAPKPVMPPPGFGNQQVHAPGFGLHPPAAHSLGAGGYIPEAPHPPTVPTVAESAHLFGDLQTANPFANNEPPASNPPFSSLSHTIPNDVFSPDDDTMMNGTPLLDSGLLNSLFMDDTSNVTKNPFAT